MTHDLVTSPSSPPVVIDAHQHVWNFGRARYDWLGPDADPRLLRSISIDELRPEIRRAGVAATVLVQAADNAEDTALMMDVAAESPEVVAIVGYVPLERPGEAAEALDALRANPLIAGIRNLIHDQADPNWLLRPDVDEGLGVLERADIPFDLVAVLPRHLELVPIISERHPHLRIVLDHLAKPPIGHADFRPWSDLISAAAENPRVYGKVSGLYSATGEPDSWTVDGLRPVVSHAVEVFGAERLMYGGDWPVSLIAGGYTRVWQALRSLIGELGEIAERRILSETAQTFYGIPQARLDAAALRGIDR
jgi:L-fuconolactonase